jgi:nicotinamidase/pyrazinamidase
LKGKGVTSVFVCGLAADYCVYFTAKDALELGFQSTIVSDATKAIDEENYKKAMEDYKSNGGQLVLSENI